MKIEITLILTALVTVLLSISQDHVVFIDNEFNPYLNRFKYYATKNHKDVDLDGLSVYFGTFNKKEDVIGECNYKTKTIRIDREAWQEGTDYFKEQLMLHELGHCILHRKHNDNLIEEENLLAPESLMKSVNVNDDKVYEDHKSYYIQELFN